MLKVRTAFISLVALATLSVYPIATSQADNSSQQGEDTPWTFNQSSPGHAPNSRDSHEGVYYPTRERAAKTPPPSPSTAGGSGPVSYHKKGTIIENPKVNVIWYGNWDANSCNPVNGSNTTASILGDLVKNIGKSAWNEINATYYQIKGGNKTFVSPSIKYSGCVVDPGSQGLSLDSPSGPQVSDVVKNSIGKNGFANDPDTVFMVLVAQNVHVEGFLSIFCGYHSAFVNKSQTIKYSFVGDPSASAGSCISQLVASPNGNVIADGMASVLAHELIEPISDPLGLSWFDDSGLENADKCAWTYGAAVKAADGSFSNMTIGGRKYLIQQNVAANTNVCVSSVQGRGNGNSGKDN